MWLEQKSHISEEWCENGSCIVHVGADTVLSESHAAFRPTFFFDVIVHAIDSAKKNQRPAFNTSMILIVL